MQWAAQVILLCCELFTAAPWPGGHHKELQAALNGSGHLLDGGAEWKLLTSRIAAHFEHAVVDEPPNAPGLRARLAVTVWYPAQFAELRRVCLARCGGEDAFCASLSRCHRRALIPTFTCSRVTVCSVLGSGRQDA